VVEVPHRLRKVRRLRGSRTHGYGQVAQHRKSGMKGGVGRAGLHKHRWTPPEPKYEGRHGFIRKVPTKAARAINVGELDTLVSRLEAEGEAKAEGARTVLDLAALGYGKLLGGGRVSRSVVAIVEKASGRAAEKLTEEGGEVRKPG